jgi:hypothetical protein
MIYNSVEKTTVYRVEYVSRIFDVYLANGELDIATPDVYATLGNDAYWATAQELFQKVVTRYEKHGLRPALKKVGAKVIKSFKA